jgi:NADPH:quinone reductase
MKAITLEAAGAQPTLRDDLPEPTPAAGELLVRVHASSANPVDNAIAAGMLAGMVEHEYPVILGRDYAGVVEQAGPGVTGYSPGDEVFGFLPAAGPIVHSGTWAELITVRETASVVRRPGGVDVATAGAAPLAAITAMAAVDALALSAGDSLLIVGATGGVGSFATQLAVRAGATVIAPALAEDEGYLREVGAAELLDRDADVAVAIRDSHPDGVDALLDVVSYAPGGFDAALKPGARVASPNQAAGEGDGRFNVMAMPTLENLRALAELLDAGALRVHVQETYGLDAAADALQALATEHTRGKRAIRLV